MSIKMEFTLKTGNKKIVGNFCSGCFIVTQNIFADMEYSVENMKNCRKTLINKCEQHLNLEGVKTQDQDRVRYVNHCAKKNI